MLTDSKSKKLKALQPKKVLEREPYTDKEKIEAAKLYLTCGNLTHTAVALGMSLNTLKKWKSSDWWSDLIQDFKSEDTIVLSNKLKKIVEKSLLVTMDRLEHGDFQYDQKEGKLVRKPVSMREANKVTKDLLDVSIKLDKPDAKTLDNQTVVDRLEALGAAFASFTKINKPLEIIDAAFKEPIDVEVTEKEV
jgi:transposase-like protein